ncbi:unnamed protein product [Rhizopus stolonifer]
MNSQKNNQESSVVISPSLNLRLIEGNDRRTEDLSTSNEIAAITPTSAGANTDVRDIRIYSREDQPSSSSAPQFHRILQNHSLYMHLYYVLIIPKGGFGLELAYGKKYCEKGKCQGYIRGNFTDSDCICETMSFL